MNAHLLPAPLRVVFDVLGSPANSGGMQLHAIETVSAWAEQFPQDSLTVVGPGWARREFGRIPGVRVVVWPNDSVLERMSGQLLVTALIAWRAKAHWLISLSPIVTPLRSASSSVCFEHDWRHKKNPAEFPAHQRFYRRLWEFSARRAAHVVCISAKAASETRRIAPGARTTVIENGRDHARRWMVLPRPSGRQRTVVTLGHKNNKRPELVIDALACIPIADRTGITVVVLGATGGYRDELRERSRILGVLDSCSFPGFVEPHAYQQLLAECDALVLASTDEGFGLAVCEAQYFGAPVVIASDSGVVDLHGEGVLAAEPTPKAMAVALSEALARGRTTGALPGLSWNETSAALRGLVAPGEPSPRTAASKRAA